MPDDRRKAEMSEAVNPEERVWSDVRAVVDVAAVINVEDMDDAGGFVDAVHDPVGATQGSVAAGQRAEQGLADAVRSAGRRGRECLYSSYLWPVMALRRRACRSMDTSGTFSITR